MDVGEAQDVKQLREENARRKRFGRRSDAGPGCVAVSNPKKLTELAANGRKCSGWKQEFDFSERHVCGLMSIPRSSYRYRSRRDDSGLREQLIELARQKPRFRIPAITHFVAAPRQRVNESMHARARSQQNSIECIPLWL